MIKSVYEPRVVKATGKAACCRCGKPMNKGEEAIRRKEGVVHRACDGMLSSSAAAELLGVSVAQFRRLATTLGIEPDATKKNPHYATAAPMALWYRATIVERFRERVAVSQEALSA